MTTGDNCQLALIPLLKLRGTALLSRMTWLSAHCFPKSAQNVAASDQTVMKTLIHPPSGSAYRRLLRFRLRRYRHLQSRTTGKDIQLHGQHRAIFRSTSR